MQAAACIPLILSVHRSLKHECLIINEFGASTCRSLQIPHEERRGAPPRRRRYDGDHRAGRPQLHRRARRPAVPSASPGSRPSALPSSAAARARLPAAEHWSGCSSRSEWPSSSSRCMRLRAGRNGGRHSITDIADGRDLLVARRRRVTAEDHRADRADRRARRRGASRQHQRALDVVAIRALAHRPRIGPARVNQGAPGARRGRVADRRATRPAGRLHRAPCNRRPGLPGRASRRRARSRDGRGRPRGHRASSASRTLVRSLRRRPRARRPAAGRLRRARWTGHPLAHRPALVRLVRLAVQGPPPPPLRLGAALRRARAPVGRQEAPDCRRARPRHEGPGAARLGHELLDDEEPEEIAEEFEAFDDHGAPSYSRRSRSRRRQP